MSNIITVSVVFILTIVGVFSVSINNGRYEDVNIVVQDSVEESDVLLERIKDVFTRTSQMLFEATRHHVYFGQINIILPRSWTLKEGFTAVAARSGLESYITIETGKVKSPHTKRRRKRCGHAGRYIYLHSEFLLQEGKTKWGHHENVLVHEWGHLRWGLFDEYTKSKSKRFYLDDGVWSPSRCSGQVEGTVGLGSRCRSSTSCTVTDTTKVMNKNCKFCPDETQSISNMSSIMAYNWVDGISMFCDKEDDETVPIHQRHNSKAPTQQNVKCKGRSAWEVMREHVDFDTDPLPATTDTTPVFNILRETDGYRVFVLDVSGSMGGQRIETLYQASEYVIQNRIPDDSWLGIVWFSSSATTKMELTQVVSQEVRDSLVAALPQTAGGGTCIGCGIENALQIFKHNLTDLTGCEIIVISDGQDGGSNLDSAVQHAVNENVTIHTISISQQADERMISMATLTGGIHISYLETGTISFASVFLEIVSSGVTEMPSITLVSETVDASTTSPFMFTFEVDDSIGYNSTVSVLQNVSSSIEISVETPNRSMLSSQQTNVESLVLDIPGLAVSGQYNVTVVAQTPFEYFVISNPTGTEVVRVVSWISPTEVDHTSGELPVVEADVMKGGAVVMNASVTAVIETGRSDPCTVSLLDDGVDPDDDADDGTYAAVIPRFCINDNGRVTAKVYARADGGTASVHDPYNSGAGFLDSDEDQEEPEVLGDSFQRVSLRNEILVSNFSPDDQDIVAPGRITDVDVVDISTEDTEYGESRNFTLTWTATGNDVNIGQATDYELRIADDIHTLINNFSAATLLDVVNANYTPKALGETEFIRIEINAEESYTSTTFFAVRAMDEAGNAGDVSNIVSILVANGYRINVEGDVDFQFSPADDSVVEVEDEGGEEKTDLTMLAIGLSCAAAVLVVVIVVAVVCFKKSKSKRKRITKGCKHDGRYSTGAVAYDNKINEI